MATIASLSVLVDADTRRFSRGMRDVQQDIKRTETMGTRMAGNFRSIAGGALIAATAVTATVTAVGAFAEAGGRASTIQAAFNQRVGDTETALSELKLATNGLVSELDLMTQANMAFTLGSADSIEQFAEMAAGAQKLGRALGLDAEFALNSLNVGIARQSRLLLDNLGLIVSVEGANRKYAAALGVAVDELTNAQRQEAFRAATLEQLRQKTEELGAVTLNAGDAYRGFRVVLSDSVTGLEQASTGNEFLIGTFQTLSQIVRLATGNLQTYDEVLAQMRQRNAETLARMGADTQFLPGRAADATDDMRAFMDEVAAFREAQNEILTFNQHLDDLGARILPVTIPKINALTGGLQEFGDASHLTNQRTQFQVTTLSEAQIAADMYRLKMIGTTQQQEQFNLSLRDSASLLGSVGGLLGAFGVSVPFLGQASGALGALGGIFGFGGGGGKGGGKKFGGGKASGGPVRAGTTYMVGEEGPEMFTPSRSGAIVPNGAGGDNVVSVTFVTPDGRQVSDTITYRQKRGENLNRVIKLPLQVATG